MSWVKAWAAPAPRAPAGVTEGRILTPHRLRAALAWPAGTGGRALLTTLQGAAPAGANSAVCSAPLALEPAPCSLPDAFVPAQGLDGVPSLGRRSSAERESGVEVPSDSRERDEHRKTAERPGPKGADGDGHGPHRGRPRRAAGMWRETGKRMSAPRVTEPGRTALWAWEGGGRPPRTPQTRPPAGAHGGGRAVASTPGWKEVEAGRGL